MSRTVCLAVVAIHFGVVFSGALQELVTTISNGVTVLPPWFVSASGKVLSAANGIPSRIQQCLVVYSHLVGIDTGYGFFAPNVPDSVRVVFIVQHADGHIELSVPNVESHSDGLRLAGLLDRISWSEGNGLRRAVVQMLARSVWRENRDASVIGARLERLTVPAPNHLIRGTEVRSSLIAAYEFRFSSRSSKTQQRDSAR